MTSGFEISGVEEIFSGVIFDIERRSVHYGSQEFEREVLVHPGAVAILAIDDLHNVVLLEQYRAALDAWILEIPAGTCDMDGEAPESTARRELLEEAGLTAGSFEYLGTFLNSPGYSSQLTTLFLASELSQGERSPVGVEESVSNIIRCPLDEALDLMRQGTILDSTTCLGLLIADARYVR